MELVADFERILALVESLESTTIPPRVKRRIANAYDQAIGKAMALGWGAKTDPTLIMEDDRIHQTLLRHAERGARDFVRE